MRTLTFACLLSLARILKHANASRHIRRLILTRLISRGYVLLPPAGQPPWN